MLSSDALLAAEPLIAALRTATVQLSIGAGAVLAVLSVIGTWHGVVASLRMQLEAPALKGLFGMLLLSILADRPLHAYALIDALQEAGRSQFEFSAQSVNPALHRLEHLGLVSSVMSVVNGRKRRTYSITPARPGTAERRLADVGRVQRDSRHAAGQRTDCRRMMGHARQQPTGKEDWTARAARVVETDSGHLSMATEALALCIFKGLFPGPRRIFRV